VQTGSHEAVKPRAMGHGAWGMGHEAKQYTSGCREIAGDKAFVCAGALFGSSRCSVVLEGRGILGLNLTDAGRRAIPSPAQAGGHLSGTYLRNLLGRA
jgi:hypothetical protein